MKPNIIMNSSKATIPAFKCRIGNAPQKTIDLALYAGEYIRIWLDYAMTYSVDKHKDHYWQIAELQVPHQMHRHIKTGEIDEYGMPVWIAEKIPIKLIKNQMQIWDIEEVAE